MSKRKLPKCPRLADRILEVLPSDCEFHILPQKVCAVKVKTDEPQTLTEWLWQQTTDIQQEALNTAFIQGMKTGTLDPNDFGIYNLQDAVYCYNATEALNNVILRSEGALKDYARQKHKSYEEYTSVLFKMWYINDPAGVRMGNAAADYSNFELKVSTDMEPIYSFIAMIPCARLWPWLGQQLAPFLSEFGVYKTWITENLTGDGYKKLEAFVNNYQPINRNTALDVYKKCMQGEANFFASAIE